MAIEVEKKGNANECRIEVDQRWSRASIRIEGDRNQVIVSEGVSLKDSDIEIIGSDNRVHIDPDCGLGFRLQIRTDGATVEIGRGTTMTGCDIFLLEPADVRIGAECMFAPGIWITVSDAHPIFDLDSGERINEADDVVVGDHVWLCRGASLMKGTHVGDGSVIGAESLVTGKIPANCIAAGNPVRVVRRNIRWDRPFSPELAAKAGFGY